MDNWYVPITLLPSVGFFIMAASAVSNALSAELARLIEVGKHSDMEIIEKKIQQLRLVNIAMVLLYCGGVLLAFAGLMAGLQFSIMIDMKGLVDVIVCTGIGLAMIALVLMMIYASRAVGIKQKQFREM